MLAEAESLFTPAIGKSMFSELSAALLSCTRDTDVLGWHRENQVLGLIFTEIGDGDRTSVIASLFSKVMAALGAQLGREQSERVHFSFHWFPEEPPEQGGGEPTDPVLYPDLFPEHDPKRLSRLLKRALDIMGSLVGLILLAPLFFAIATLIKLTSRGPILFRQNRVGQHNSIFTMWKFRTMKIGNDPTIHQEFVKRLIDASQAGKTNQAGAGIYKITHDPRVTRLGKWLRKMSLDELPQFVNVLKGDMSLVGPRPPIPYELAAYRVWHRRRLLEAKPGITGLWQVSGRSRTKFDDMVRMDLTYARTWTLWMDIRILLKTPRAVFSGQGAY